MIWQRQRNDAALVREVLGGRHDQFALLVERHLPRVLAIAGARVPCRADADDAAQEAFLKAYTSLDTLKDHARFAPWLTAIVRNVCATLQRARREEPVELTPAHEPAVEPEHETRELHAVLRREIDRLEPDAREVLLLHYFAGLKIREMAETLSISPAAAGKRLDRARDALGQQLITQLGPALDLYKPREGQAKRLSAVVLAVRPPWPTVPLSAAAVATSLTGLTVLKALITGAALIAAASVTIQHFGSADPPQQTVQVAKTIPKTPPVPPAAQPTPPSAPAQPGEPQIAGRVYDVATGQSIAGLPVLARRGKSDQAVIKSVVTDRDGNFMFDRLSEGRWTIQTNQVKSYPYSPTVMANVVLGQRLDGVDFPLRKGVPLRGRVIDSSGATVADACIYEGSNTWQRMTAEQGGETTRTDAQGQYELWFAHPREVVLRACAKGALELETRGAIVQSVGAEGLDGVDLVVYPVGSIAGLVKNSAGQPVRQAQVVACIKGPAGYEEPDEMNRSEMNRCSTLDDNGAFKITELHEGTYLLKIKDLDVQEVTLDSGQHIENLAIRADLPPPPVSEAPAVSGVTEWPFAISGRVLGPGGTPLPSARIECISEDESNAQISTHGMVQQDGTFKIYTHEQGLYEVRASCPPYAFTSRSGVAAGSNNIELKLGNECELKGKVVHSDSGEPVKDFAVAVLSRSTRLFYERIGAPPEISQAAPNRFCDSGGNFVLIDREVPQEPNCSLLVEADGCAAQVVPLPANATQPGVATVVRLEREARIEGQVLDSRGQPVSDALILPGRDRSDDFNVLRQQEHAKTDADGRFVADKLPSMDLALTVAHPKFSKTSVQVSTRIGNTATTRVILEDGSEITTQVMAGGQPFAGAKLSLLRDARNQIGYAETDAYGRCLFQGLTPGPYSIKAVLPGLSRETSRSFILAAGQHQDLLIDFNTGTASLSGAILLPEGTPSGYDLDLRLRTASGDEESFNERHGGLGSEAPARNTYRVENLPQGQGEIEIKVFWPLEELGKSCTRRLPVSVVDGQAQVVDFDFRDSLTAEGTVSGYGPDDACWMYAFPAELNIGPEVPIESLLKRGRPQAEALVVDGRFTLRGLDPGDYTLVVLAYSRNVHGDQEIFATARRSQANVHLEEGQTTKVDFNLP